jgi:hypothetical protein
MERSPNNYTYDYYRFILRAAADNGYEFISFPELAGDVPTGTDRVCALRHDCDNDLTAAVLLARFEQEMGVRSTYFIMLRSAMYNLLARPNADLAREIIGRGHWIGLHFDEHFYPDCDPERLAELVDRERDWLAAELGVPVDVVSFHQPSAEVLANRVRLNCVNTYDRQRFADVHYLSDSNMIWQEACPSELFRARRHPRLQLLLHPEWWTAEEMPIEQKWMRMLRNNFALMQRSLLERERAYRQELDVAFLPREGSADAAK